MSATDQQDSQALILERVDALMKQIAGISSQMNTVGERVDTLAQAVALVQHDVIHLKRATPVG